MSRTLHRTDAQRLQLADWIRPGDRVLWGQACAEPQTLTRLLVEQRHAIARQDRFGIFLGIGAGRAITPACADCMDMVGYCGTGTTRTLAQGGCLDMLPIHYSQMDRFFADGRIAIDVVMVQVTSEPQGGWRLSLAQEYLAGALRRARVVIAQCNPSAPHTPGALLLGANDIDVLIEAAEAPLSMPPGAASSVEERIAEHVASLIDDGDTLQFGLGSVPEAVLARLHDRRDLGIHSGLLSDGAAELMAAGVANGARKTRNRGVAVAGVLMGTQRLFGFAHGNPGIRLESTAYTHDIEVLGSLDALVAINSAVEIDLSGQINAEVARGVHVGAVGGGVDFLRGAARSRGGKPVIALPSTAGAHSRIVAALQGPVTTARSDVAFVVTEHGIADLRGATLRQRRERLIAIAHPEHRAALDGPPISVTERMSP